MGHSAQMLFGAIDHELDHAATTIRNRVFSEYRDMPWTPEYRARLEPLVRRELDLLIQGILGLLDNVGCVLPEETSGWTICNRQDSLDIRDGTLDYSDMWLEFLNQKMSDHTPSP